MLPHTVFRKIDFLCSKTIRKHFNLNDEKNIPFRVIDWEKIETSEHSGTKGNALWQTVQFPGLRVRIVKYTKGYFADHWCRKGHIVHCLDGEFTSELETGELFTLKQGMTYVVSDDLSSHRSRTESGVKLLIVDGDFLKKYES